MEEFVCNAKLNLIRLVSDRLQKKYSVTITLGDLILEDDSGEQWIQVTDGSAEQRRAVKHYLITLCNSEDACIVTYDEKYECSIQAHQDELERNSGACLVLSQPGVVNIYGSEFSVTMAQTALEDMKEKFGDIDDEDEGLTEAQLNEKLKVKCAEHDIMFEDYVHASLPVKRTLYRWLSHDMDHSSSLVEEEPDAPCDNDLEMDCPVIDLDKTLSGIDVQDSRVKIILKRGYALQEYNDVIREIGDQSGIPAILTKLLDNRRKKGLTPPLSIPRTSDVGSTDNDTATSNATSSGISSATSTGIGVGTDVVLGNTEAAKNDDVIDLTSESAVDLSLYFEEYFEEGPNLTREEYIERNLKRQQLLLAEAQKLKKQKAENASQALINALTKVPDEATEQVKKKKNKKKRQKKKAKGSTPKKSDSSSSDEVEIMITEETSPVNTPTKNYSKTPARNVDTIGNKARVNLALQHSPMAENTTVKKKQKTSEILSDVIVGPSEGPLQSTPLLNPPTQEEWQIAGARALRGRPDSVERTLVPTESRVPLPMSDYVAKGASNLRPIVIDGSNVACAHGRQQVFSSRGIQIAVDFFKNRGHQDVTVFVPNWRKGGLNAAMPTKDSDILLQLEKDGILSFTPSRYLNGKKLVCYDDRFIVELAADNDGVVVSNDNFRDLINESPKWKRVIESRLLMYTFAGNKFMVPDDPLGPQGPRLEQMLTKAPTKRQPQSSLAGAPLLPGIVRPLVQAPGAPGPVYAPAPFASLPGLAPSPVLTRGGAWGSMPSSSLASSWGATGAPGGPSRDFSGRPTWNTMKPPPCRPIAQTEALYKQLLELFPNIPSVIQRILDNHMNETDVNKLTIHILDVIK